MSSDRDRIEDLERALRRWSAATTLLALALAALVLLGAAQAPPEQLRVRGLELVGEDGATVLRLRAWPLGGLVEVLNDAGEVTTWIGQTADGHGVVTTGTRDGQPAFAAGGATGSGHGYLALFSNRGRLGLKLQGGRISDTGGLVQLFDQRERELARLESDARGRGRLQLSTGANWSPIEPD